MAAPYPWRERASMAPPILATEQGSGVGQVDGALTAVRLDQLRRDFEANRNYRLAQNAVTQVTADDIALNRAIVNGTDQTFSHLLDEWSVTNQKQSGRC